MGFSQALLFFIAAAYAQSPAPLNLNLPPSLLAPLNEGDNYSSLNNFFDGQPERKSKTAASNDYSSEVDVRNGELARFAIVNNRWKLAVEGGYLGLSGSRNGLLMPSPYVNIVKHAESDPGSWVDYRLRAQLGMVDLTGRFFNDSMGADPALDQSISRLGALAGNAGMSAQDINEYMDLTHYQDTPARTKIVVGSLLGQVGRAYSLFGPVDVAWAVGGLVKLSYLMPNVALDASAGPRVHLSDTQTLSLLGGITENVSPVNNRLMDSVFRNEKIKLRANYEEAPHTTLVYNAPMPWVEGAVLGLSGTRQWNADTRSDQFKSSVSGTVWGTPAELSAFWRHEYGSAIEFDRLQSMISLTARLTKEISLSAGYQTEDIRYGDAQVKNDYFMTSVSMRFGGPGRANDRLDIEQRFGGKDRLSTPPAGNDRVTQAARALNAAINQAMDAASSAQLAAALIEIPDSIDVSRLTAQLSDLAARLRTLSPEATQAFLDSLPLDRLTPAQSQMLQTLLGSADLEQWLNDPQRAQDLRNLQAQIAAYDWTSAQGRLGEIRELLTILSSDGFMEKVAIRIGRNRMLDALAKVDDTIPYLNMNFKATPAVFMAALQILQSRPSPLAPVTARDARENVEPWLWQSLARGLGMDRAATPEQISRELLSQVTDSIRGNLEDLIAPGLYQQVGGMTAQQTIATAMGYLPPSVQDRLRAAYGNDLSGLIAPGASGETAFRSLLDAAVDQMLQERLGPAAQQGTEAMVAWLAGLLRSQINAELLQLMLAAEQLDVLTVDHGRKIGVLQDGMIMDSFDKLDWRKGRVRKVLKGARDSVELMDLRSARGR